MSPEPIPLLTSLPPRMKRLDASGRDIGADYAAACRDSWIASGFRPVTVEEVAAPYPLSQPVGWLGQALDGDAHLRLTGPCTPVLAWADPAFWAPFVLVGEPNLAR